MHNDAGGDLHGGAIRSCVIGFMQKTRKQVDVLPSKHTAGEPKV